MLLYWADMGEGPSWQGLCRHWQQSSSSSSRAVLQREWQVQAIRSKNTQTLGTGRTEIVKRIPGLWQRQDLLHPFSQGASYLQGA